MTAFILILTALFVIPIVFILVSKRKLGYNDAQIEPVQGPMHYRWEVTKNTKDSISIELKYCSDCSIEIVDQIYIDSSTLSVNQLKDEIARIKSKMLETHQLLVSHSVEVPAKAFGSGFSD